MSVTRNPVVSEEYRTQLAEKGQALYDTQLKDALEPAHNGEYIVLHVDQGDYALGNTYREASQAMRTRHGINGRLYGFRIGLEPDSDGLVSRILLSEMRESLAK